MGNSFFKKLDYGKSALLIPILVIIAVVLGDSFKEFVPFEIREQYKFWFYLTFSALSVLAGLISIILAVLSFFKKQSIVFGIIGTILSSSLLVIFGFILAIIIF
jgi:hypothetical protein